MCSIFGSSSWDKINELQMLNSYRGALSHSVTFFDNTGKIIHQEKNRGPMHLLNPIDGVAYILCHQQAPTTQETNSIHPAFNGKSMLWHNGIIKDFYLKKMIAQSKIDNQWDTFQLNQLIEDYGFAGLRDVSGSFSCVRYDTEYNELQMFRNDISPMFVNEDTISSTEFEGSISTDPGSVYKLRFAVMGWDVTSKFRNIETPFFYLD